MSLKKWKQLTTRVCCANQWVTVREDRVELPNGQLLESYIVGEHCGAVAVLAFDDKGRVLLVRQYRYPISSFSWEIPSGALSGADKVLESGERELFEETGYVARTFSYLTAFHPSPGSTNEVIHIVEAKSVSQHETTPPEGKDLFEVDWVPFHDIVRSILDREITHSPTIVACFHILARASDTKM